MDRRFFLAVSGGALTAPAWSYVDRLGNRGGSFAALADAGRSMTVTSTMVEAIAATTTGIRNLGDAEGGHEDHLRFVHHHPTWVGKLLRQARFANGAVADRLLAEWAQLAAWMAHDAGTTLPPTRPARCSTPQVTEDSPALPCLVRAN